MSWRMLTERVGSLMYALTKGGQEIDILVEQGMKTPPFLIEFKLSDISVSKNFNHFLRFFLIAIYYQLVRNHSRVLTAKKSSSSPQCSDLF